MLCLAVCNRCLLRTNSLVVPVRFQAVGSAPILRQKVFKVSASQKFETVVNFLRKKLECKPTDSVFLYVNSVFAPGLDEGVGNLYRVSHKEWFKIHYALSNSCSPLPFRSD